MGFPVSLVSLPSSLLSAAVLPIVVAEVCVAEPGVVEPGVVPGDVDGASSLDIEPLESPLSAGSFDAQAVSAVANNTTTRRDRSGSMSGSRTRASLIHDNRIAPPNVHHRERGVIRTRSASNPVNTATPANASTSTPVNHCAKLVWARPQTVYHSAPSGGSVLVQAKL